MKKILFLLFFPLIVDAQSPTNFTYIRRKELVDLTSTNFSAPSPYTAIGVYQGVLYYLVNGQPVKRLSSTFDFPSVSGKLANDVLTYNGSGGALFQTLKTIYGGSLLGEGNITFNTDQITEGSSNLYFTVPRVRSSLSFVSGSGGYNSSTGVISIPTNNNEILNGANYITPDSLLYDGISPTTVTVGGLAAGTNISGQSLEHILQSIVSPYIQPVFTSFSITGQATTVEIGTTLLGSKTFTWSINPGSGVVATIGLYDNTAAADLLASTSNDGTKTQLINTIQLNTNGATQSWKGIGHNTSPVGDFNSINFVVTARYILFYGASLATPTNSAQVRALPSSGFYTGAATLTLNTGTTLKKFDVALPPGSSITQVIDIDALNAVITSQYVNTGTVSVTDAGGTARTYTLYEMNTGVPYSTNHRHQITIN